MFQLTHKKEPARTIPAALKLKLTARSFTQSQTLPQALGRNPFLSSGPEDWEPLVGPEDLGMEGVEVESEYDLELRIGGNVGRIGMGHTSLLTVPNKTVRW
jgi:hypothetical protein